mmetsp:Transcript_56050/g.88810  ORF Transcript_56050/g.88810 Transcript_56050/m.88810 type:complete len:581 (+) Transcript_56050:155-1897(+)
MSSLFDFDALDEILDGSDEKASESTSCSDGEVSAETTLARVNNYHHDTIVDQEFDLSDNLSEIWPGEEFQFMEEDDDDDDHFAYHSHAVWEVVFKPRIVVRREPQPNAEPVRFASTDELFFSDPHFSSGDWIKLSMEPGYILKDGHSRNPNWGMLIQPFDLDNRVPVACRGAVFGRLRSMWVNVRHHPASGSLLKPPIIPKLRMGFDGAISSALSTDGSFCLRTFKEQLAAIENAVKPPPPPPPVSFLPSTSPWSYSEPMISRSSPSMVTMDFFLSLLNDMTYRRQLPCAEDVKKLVYMVMDIYAREDALVRLEVPSGATLHVVGDLHGQFWDFCNVVDLFGAPSRKNWYLFNGDFVDRGQFSVEVVIALFTMKVALPDCVHLNRGNHESVRMNMLYGFMGETLQKYSSEIFDLFNEAFKSLPLATAVNSSVLVVHGGLPRQDGVQLQEIERVDRRRDLDETAPDLMIDLLWSDPMAGSGRANSPRGAGFLFGCDVTEKFCDDNGLLCVIRSHEMKFEGFEWLHNDRCLTIFSAANYCDICGNFGAVCNITPHSDEPRISRSDLSIQRFEASPHPNEPRY